MKKVLCCILVTTLSLILFSSCVDPASQAIEAFQAENYNAVSALVQEHGETAVSSELLTLLFDMLNNLETDFSLEILNYEQVSHKLTQLKDLGIDAISGQLADTIEFVEKLHFDRTHKTVWLMTSQRNLNANATTTYEWSYDSQGKLTGYSYKSQYVDIDYSEDYEYLYFYNSLGNIDRVTVNNQNEVAVTLLPTYEDELLLKYVSSTSNPNTVIVFEYDQNGYPVAMTADALEFSAQYQYDVNGMMQESVEYIYSGSMEFEKITKYDSNGNLSESIVSNGLLSSRTVATYNKHNHLEYAAGYTDGKLGTVTIVEYKYDEDGRITALLLNDNGVLAEGTFSGDDTVRTLTFSSSSSSYDGTTIVLEYDSAGNLIHQTKYQNNKIIDDTTYSFIALQLPLDYKQPSTKDPHFLLWLSVYLDLY